MLNKAVVILNYNGQKHLKNYLANVINNTSQLAQIIVIDNASTDSSVEYLKANFSETPLIQLDKNYGFAGGYNMGLKQVKQEYLVLLNSDIEVSKDWDLPIWIKLEQENVGAVQPKIVDLKDKTMYEYAGAAGGLVDKFYFPFCRGRVFSEIENSNIEYNDSSSLFWASGAAFGIRKTLFEKIGGFDVDFFAHMEEIDVCFRLQNQGYSINYCAKSTIYHLGGGTLNMMSPFKTYLNYRNGLKLIYKNHYTSNVFLLLFIRMCLDGLSAINFLFRGIPKHSIAIFKGHLHFYTQLNKTAKKRKHLKTLYVGGKPKGLYSKSIVADYFLRGVKSYKQINSKYIND